MTRNSYILHDGDEVLYSPYPTTQIGDPPTHWPIGVVRDVDILDDDVRMILVEWPEGFDRGVCPTPAGGRRWHMETDLWKVSAFDREIIALAERR